MRFGFKQKLICAATAIVLAISFTFIGGFLANGKNHDKSTRTIEHLECKKITILSDDDMPMAFLSSDKNGGQLALFDRNGKIRIGLGMADNNMAILKMLNPEQQTSILIGDNAESDGYLFINDRNGQRRFILAALQNASMMTMHTSFGGESDPAISLIADPVNLTVVSVKQGRKFGFLRPR